MKKIILVVLVLTLYLNCFGKTWIITNSGLNFTPSTLIIHQGDDVTFTINAIHDAVEVSQAVWNANGTFPVIGFSVPFGGGSVPAALLSLGNHYYICENHGSLGMKGTISVETSLGFEDHKVQNDILIYPNPVKDHFTVQLDLSELQVLEIKLYNIQGKLVSVLLPKTKVSGTFLQSFNLGKTINQGVYFIQIAKSETISFQKVIIL